MTKWFQPAILTATEEQEKLEQKIAKAKHVNVDDSENEFENEGTQETEEI